MVYVMLQNAVESAKNIDITKKVPKIHLINNSNPVKGNDVNYDLFNDNILLKRQFIEFSRYFDNI